MGPADDVDAVAKASPLFAKYGTRTDGQSAREMLAARLQKAVAPDTPPAAPEHARAAKAAAGGADMLGDFLKSGTGNQIQCEVIRGVFGMLKKSL